VSTATANRQAIYKGKTYRLEYLGPTKYGRKAKLAFRDGTKEFWVAADLVEEITESTPSAARYGSYRTIGARMAERQRRTGWTGCSCGSIEGQPRDSDCWECRHDSE
jgi:hypothetical protein